MKKLLLLVFSLLFFGQFNLNAQSWVNGGNSLTSNGSIGTTTNYSFLFKTKSTERGRITNTGLWGIGTPYPNSKLHINTIVNQDPLRVMYNGSTKLFVHRSGGVAIGSANTPPANGLDVSGNVAIGTTTPAASNKLEVFNSTERGTGIYTTGALMGLKADATSSSGTAVQAFGGLYGVHSYGYIGLYTFGETTGVQAITEDGIALNGNSSNGTAVFGTSEYGTGASFFSTYGNGLEAFTFSGDWAGYFRGNLFSTGTYQGSDKNLKKNIQDMDNAMDIINSLKPKYYQFRDDGKYASLRLPKGMHYGLLAQDVEEVLPNLVKESAHVMNDYKPNTVIKPSADGKPILPTLDKEPKEKINIKAVNYTEMIPIVIKGMQEQQQIIQQLQQENSDLKNRLTKIEAALSLNNNNGVEMGAYLQQNQPNPFTSATTIPYNIPKGAKAKILVYDAAGKLVKTLAASDAGQVQINTASLSTGTYVYSLMVNGKLVGTKQMIVAK